MTNTLNNVPRELLERVTKYCVSAPNAISARNEVRALLSAPSPAGVDGLEVIGWYTEDHLDDKSATTYSKEVAERWLAKGWTVTGIANAADAQAISDGLRGEVEDLQMELSDTEERRSTAAHNSSAFEDRMGDYQVQNGKLHDRCDQQAKRIGELEGLLRTARSGLGNSILAQNIDMALSICASSADGAALDFLNNYIVTADDPVTGKTIMLADSGTLRECIAAALSAGKENQDEHN